MGIGTRRQSQGQFYARHGAARQIYAVRRRRARLADQAAASPNSTLDEDASRRNSASASRSCGASRRRSTRPDWCSTPSAGRLRSDTGGGSFLYHFDDDLVSIGFVVHLNYSNPTLSPFDEFQRFKTHPMIAPTLEGGERLSYGARALTEGGWQSVPKLVFPGGALIGCAAGFMNVPRIKGLAQRDSFGHSGGRRCRRRRSARAARMTKSTAYDAAWRGSDIGRDLKPVRNVKPLLVEIRPLSRRRRSAASTCGRTSCSASPSSARCKHGKPDYATLKPLIGGDADRLSASSHAKIVFDKLSSVFVSNTNHEEDQPVASAAGRSRRFPIARQSAALRRAGAALLPGGRLRSGLRATRRRRRDPRFVINAQNCVHCKTCDIKDPAQNITWVPPEGGGGPNYPNM